MSFAKKFCFHWKCIRTLGTNNPKTDIWTDAIQLAKRLFHTSFWQRVANCCEGQMSNSSVERVFNWSKELAYVSRKQHNRLAPENVKKNQNVFLLVKVAESDHSIESAEDTGFVYRVKNFSGAFGNVIRYLQENKLQLSGRLNCWLASVCLQWKVLKKFNCHLKVIQK